MILRSADQKNEVRSNHLRPMTSRRSYEANDRHNVKQTIILMTFISKAIGRRLSAMAGRTFTLNFSGCYHRLNDKPKLPLTMQNHNSGSKCSQRSPFIDEAK
jgi:hypothetical protein